MGKVSTKGVIDMHVHSNPDIRIRAYDDFELIDKQTIELFVDIIRISNYLIKCIINEGKIRYASW